MGPGTWRCSRTVMVALMALSATEPAHAQGTQAVEDLSIGRVDGPVEYTLAQVAGLAVAPDGAIWVLDSGDATVKVYDQNGRFLRGVGGSGSGPGEFQAPSEIAVQGDTVAVYDPRLRRLTLFRSNGDLLTTDRVQAGASFTRGLEPLGDGTFLLGLVAGNRMPPDPKQDGKMWLFRISHDGSILDTLLTTNGPRQLVERTADGMVVGSAPFQRWRVWAVAKDGRIAFGDGESYEITLHRYPSGPPSRGTDATVLGTFHRDIPNRPVTRADEQEYEEGLLESAGGSEDVRRAYRRLLDELDFPETWPAYRQVLFDDDGRLWVEREWPSSQLNRSLWEVLDPEGSLIGSVIVDGDVDVQVIRGSYLYGIQEDEFEVQYVKRLRFEGIGSGRP